MKATASLDAADLRTSFARFPTKLIKLSGSTGLKSGRRSLNNSLSSNRTHTLTESSNFFGTFEIPFAVYVCHCYPFLTLFSIHSLDCFDETIPHVVMILQKFAIFHLLQVPWVFQRGCVLRLQAGFPPPTESSSQMHPNPIVQSHLSPDLA